MEVPKACILFAFCLLCACVPEVLSDCHANDDCPCAADTGEGGRYPIQPLKWREFESIIVDGESREYLEVYSLTPRTVLPALTKVIYRWVKTSESGVDRYFNPVSGWFDDFQFCFDDAIEYSRTADTTLRYSDRLQFEFDFLIPDAVRYVGTSFSSCPDRYLINWYCPKANFSDNYCFDGLQMSITAINGPYNLPWHLITRDLCRNKAPFLDDTRWHFTYIGPQCQLHRPDFNRKKRDVSCKWIWPIYSNCNWQACQTD